MKVNKSISKGFSLVEMLVVIAIIGVIAAIAVPQISDFTGAAKDSKDKRNAQNLSSVCSAAQAAGLDFVTLGGSDLKATINAIVSGSTVTDGAFLGEFFGVPNMSDRDKTECSPYLFIDATGTTLQYTATKGTGITFP